MTSTGANHQHPPSTSAEISTTQPAHSSSLDPTTHLPTSGYAPNDNQLAGLVEAATAAAGQDVSDWATAAAVAAAAGAAGNQHHLDGYGPELHIDDDGFEDAGFGASLTANRQLRGSGEQGPPSGLSRTVSKKRKRNEDTLDPALAAASSGMGLGAGHHQHHNQHHNPHPQQYEGDGLDIRPVPAQSLSDARSVGLHSASALFRQPSSNKKHTRPPMAKMFTSLELSPENFLQLQAAAKNYMLDDGHPERRECVGQRGKGDSEMVKLRLWNCVRHFLEAEGHGERFFGESAINEGIGQRAHLWPRDQQKIIALIIPLLRRMVTNERQRQYAIETRKGGGPDDRRRRKTDESLPNANSASPPRYDEQFQMHAQHHTIPEEFTTAPSAPSMPTPQPQMGQSASDTQLGLTNLLLDGYPTDWEAVARSYDLYNHDYELDNLWSLSGLQQPDWRGLVAAVDSHYQVFHHGDYDCPKPCEDENIHRILEAEAMDALGWRVGGSRYTPAKNEFASGITRDISRIIRDNLASKHGVHAPAYDQQPASHSPYYPHHSHSVQNTTNSSSASHTPMLNVNILQNGKRILPRFDLSAEQCPDLGTLKHVITHRFGDQLPAHLYEPKPDGTVHSTIGWKVKVFVPDGITSVRSDGEWTIALLSAATVDWMDSNLKVLVDAE